jgi:hypothetical protein
MLWSSHPISDGRAINYAYLDPRAAADRSHFSLGFGLGFHQDVNTGRISFIQLTANILIHGSNDCVNTGPNDTKLNKISLSMGSAGLLIDPNGYGETTRGTNQIYGILGAGSNTTIPYMQQAALGFMPSAAELESGQISIVASYRAAGRRPDGTQYPGNGSCNCDINATHYFVIPDKTPPHITLSFGGATLTRDPDTSIFKYYSKDSTVFVEWSAVDDEGTIKSIDLQGSHTSSVTSDTKLIYAAPKGSYGPWFATATDDSDNTNDYSDSSLVTSPIALDTDGSFELVVDPDPPEVNIAVSSSANIVNLAGRKFAKTPSVQLQITATDAVSGCKEIDLYLNGTLSSSLGTSASSATVTAAEGANIVQIYAKDYAGNEAYTGGVTFYYNSSPPVGYINFSAQDSVLENGGKYWTKESQINVDLTYGDGGLEPSGIYKGLVVLNGAAPTTKSQFTESLSGTSKTNHTVSGLNNGSNTISFYVINNVEKISTGDSITIWVETNDSTGTMAGVEATSSFFEDGIDYTNTNKHDVNLTHSDSDSQLF